MREGVRRRLTGFRTICVHTGAMPSDGTQVLPARARLALAFYAYAGGSLDAGQARRVADAAGGLAVRRLAGLSVAREVRNGGWAGPILVDPALYERAVNPAKDVGDGTLFGDRHEVWAERQRSLDVVAYLSPSAWVPAGRYDLLEQVLEDAARFCGGIDDRAAYAVLPIHSRWLTEDPERLIASAASCGHRIALVLGHKYNPLDSVNVVRGLINFLSRVPNTLLLRSDISVVGALAHGAGAGAYGTSSTVRHLWPPDEKNLRGGGPVGVSTVLSGGLLRHIPTDKLEQIPEDGGALDCWVTPCDGESIRRFAHPRHESDLDVHDLHTVRALAEQALEGPSADPSETWREMCRTALDLHARLSPPGKARLEPKRYLSAWVRACSDQDA